MTATAEREHSATETERGGFGQLVRAEWTKFRTVMAPFAASAWCTK